MLTHAARRWSTSSRANRSASSSVAQVFRTTILSVIPFQAMLLLCSRCDENSVQSMGIRDRLHGGGDLCRGHTDRTAWGPRADGETASDPTDAKAQRHRCQD